ncbi:hypothetical protein C3942_12075 [Solimonas fluminis]|uniref:Uncharacterized protein n=1 Tax=Solimonas fluminis TaxID=2086571 RepID=A0A2S5TEY2_9GAMM|nr:hypothetical protein [Solimonas fluminis]PPE73535.1 hypothetical protein C3942_12075 [Solimonas fluminis]
MANRNGAEAPRKPETARDPNDAILGALNADRATPDHGADARGPSARQADRLERRPAEKPARPSSAL